MRQNYPRELRKNVLLTRYPIVFIHGIKGLYNFKDYWNGIPEFLQAHGFEVHELFTHWRGPQSRRLDLLQKNIRQILEDHLKLHIIAHSMGTLDTLKILDSSEFMGRIESATLISPPFSGSPFADLLAFLTPGLHKEVQTQGAQKIVNEFKNKAGVYITTILAEPDKHSITPLLRLQHKLLKQLLKKQKQSIENDGLVPLNSQKYGIDMSQKVLRFPGDHHQVIGAGPWPEEEQTAHDFLLDHCIFLAERDLLATE